MQFVQSNDGTSIAFRKSGSGPALLLVHGTTADHRRWLPILPRFERHFTVYAMDRRGRGGSGDAPDYSYRREAEDVAAVVDAIGTDINVLGHSYGAICCLEAALLTANMRRLILYEPPIPPMGPPAPPGAPERMQALIERDEREAALELFMRQVVRMPEHELADYRKLPMWQGRIELVPTVPRELAIEHAYHFDPQRFADLTTPTLLLLGADSPHFFHDVTRVLDAALPDSRVVTLPDAQHIAMDTDPALFADVVTQFLLA